MSNWTEFTRRIFIKAPKEKIFKAWTTQEMLETWFLRRATFESEDGSVQRNPTEICRKGDSFVWEWHNWDGRESGRIMNIEDNSGLTFTFADGAVEVSIREKDDRCLVSLVQRNIAMDDDSRMKVYVGCSNAWTFWLTNLKAWLEHGILLHNTEEGSTKGYDGFEMINI